MSDVLADIPGQAKRAAGKVEDIDLSVDFNPSLDGNVYRMTDAEEQKLLAWLNKTHDERWLNQAELRRRLAKLRDYDAGRQAWDESQKMLVGHEMAGAQSDDNDIDQEYHIFNIIRRLSGANVQRLSAPTIQPNVTPNSTDPDDKEGARLGRIALADMYRRMGPSKIKRRIATIINKYGSVFQKVYFDPMLGRKVHPLVEKPALIPGDPSTWDYDMGKLEPEGEVVKKYFAPGNIVLPVNTRSIEDTDELEEVHVESVGWIWRTHKVKVESESITRDNIWGPDQFDVNQRDVEYERGIIKNSVVYKARYINPSPEFTAGAIIFYTRKHIFRCTDLLSFYDSIQECWQSASAIYKEETPFGDSWLWDQIPVQDGLNLGLTSQINYVQAYGMLQQQAPANANIKMDKVNNSSLNIVTYIGEKGLEPIAQTPLPVTHTQLPQLMLSMTEDLGAAHDIRRPEGTPSGNAINSLRQIDDSMVRPCLEDIGEMLSKGDETVLRLMAENYTNPRLMKMMGKEGWEIKDDFTGEMLNGNFNAKIDLLTGLSDDPGVRMEQVLKLSEGPTPIISDPAEGRMLLGMDNTDEMMEEMQKEAENAQRVVKALANYPDGYTFIPGQPPVCNVKRHTWDNQKLIITKEIAWMRENYDHAEPEVQQAFDADLNWRQQLLAAMTMPPPPGAGAPAEAMAPEHGFGAPPPGAPKGQAPAAKGPAGGSQHPSQQPPRPVIPPAATGLAQA